MKECRGKNDGDAEATGMFFFYFLLLFYFLTLQYCIGFAIYQHESPKESSPAPQIKSINSSVLSFLYGSTLTSIHRDSEGERSLAC